MPTLAATVSLDRQSVRRADKDWLAAKQGDQGARFMILVEFSPAILSNEERTETEIRWFSRAEITTFGLERDDTILLGTDADDTGYFAINITEHRARHIPGGPYILKPYVDVRSLAVQGVLDNESLSLAGQARAISSWHRAARCCGYCGGVTKIKDGGWRRRCWSCGQEHFPRIDPVVIMLVTRGDKCILGREKNWPNQNYSALAGFMEHGETIEHAVRREVLEEVGIEVGAVTYQESQPWPFPYSLMIACRAEACSGEICIDEDELQDARWFGRDDVRKMLDGKHPDEITAPGRYAIANKLLLSFLET